MSSRVRTATYLLLLGALSVTAAAQSDDEGLDSLFQTPVDVPRLALVVGVQEYSKSWNPVPNARNDAGAISTALSTVGFTVDFLPDPETSDQIIHALKVLAMRAGNQPADIVLFFAGHGFQDGAINYLVPGQARPDELLGDSVPVTSLLLPLSGRPAGITVLLLDACRTSGNVRTPDDPNSQPGFGTVAVPWRGTIVGMAAGYNHSARSRAQEGDLNSPYTTALKDYITREGLPIEQMFNDVQRYVERLTGGDQSPEIASKLGGAFYFQPTATQRASEEATWRATLRTRDRACVFEYVKAYPDSRYARAALAWLAGDYAAAPGGERCPNF